MKWAELRRTIKAIEMSDSGVQVVGRRAYPGATYELDCVDTVSGYPFVVRSFADWDREPR